MTTGPKSDGATSRRTRDQPPRLGGVFGRLGQASPGSGGGHIRDRFRTFRFAAFVMLSALAGIAFVSAGHFSAGRAYLLMRQQAAETLAVQAEVLNGVLEKYRLLPPLLARQDDIVVLFENLTSAANDDGAAAAMAQTIAGLSGAYDVALFSPEGRLLASARETIGDRPQAHAELLKAARENRLGRSAVLIDGDHRLYVFGYGVRDQGVLVGVITVYVEFEAIERTWALSADPIFVTDSAGLVFLSNRESLLLKPQDDVLKTLGADDQRAPGAAGRYIDLTRDLPLMGWRLHVLGNRAPVVTARNAGAAIAVLVCLVLATLVFTQINRTERRVMQSRRERAQALRLERAVRERTRALSLANRNLSHEIDERIEAERRLKNVQGELVQTGKLAVLGQMSATLSHELNQPMAAIETYAANSKRALTLGKTSIVDSNLDRIAAMVQRMAELSRSLLSFSRRPDTTIYPVLVSTALDEALILTRARARKAKVAIEIDPALATVHVMAGRIRLSQVFVNLINNAIDALSQTDGARQIEIRLEDASERVVFTVADNGPGIAPETRGSIFEPFFTTKRAIAGNGIGLSVVYNIMGDFSGGIAVADSESGAVFRLWLPAAEATGQDGQTEMKA